MNEFIRRTCVIGAALSAVSSAACGGDEVVGLRLVRVPGASDGCFDGAMGSAARVLALGDFPVDPRTSFTFSLEEGEVAISGFPDRLEAIGVEVIGGGGEVLAVGRSGVFDFDQVEDGDEIAVLLAPPDGGCQVGTMSAARSAPAAARAGDSVIVLGGSDGDGPVAAVELYRRATGRFEVLEGDSFADGGRGFAGTQLTSLGPSAVATGGPATAWQVWGEDGASEGPRFLPEARAFHAAAAIDESRVLLAAGCAQVREQGDCEVGSALRTSSILDIESGSLEPGPRLAADRIGGALFPSPAGGWLLVGGVDADGQAQPIVERLTLEDTNSEELGAVAGTVAAQTISGAVVVGYGRGTSSDELGLVPASRGSPAEGIGGSMRDSPTLTALEEGTVLVAGGGAVLSRYRPFDGAVIPIDAGDVLDPDRRGHAAVLLADGAVLIVGGTIEGGEALAEAHVFRPPLLGALSNADITARFSDLEAAAAWVPGDPRRFIRVAGATSHAQLESSGQPSAAPSEIALVAGPVYQSVDLTLTGAADEGLALVVGYRAGDAWMVLLAPGQPATPIEVGQDGLRPLDGCGPGEVVASADVGADGTPVVIAAEISDSEILVRAGERILLRCDGAGSPPRGHLGAGVLGPEGSVLRIDTLSASRRP